jgi:ribosomal protein S18 acetylase RimI-like enzyme
MTAHVEILEVNSLDMKTLKELTELLIKIVEDGASVGFLSPLDEVDSMNYWKEVMGPGVFLWVARLDGKMIGTVQLHLAMKKNATHRAEVAKLMILPDERRKGIARLLMQYVEDKAVEQGRNLLILDTRSGDPSNNLYRSLGYIEAGKIPNYAKSSNGKLDDTIFYYKQR